MLSRELGGAALVNPCDTGQTAHAVGRALAMPLDERLAQWDGMMTHLRRHDVGGWCPTFLDRRHEAPEERAAG